MCSSLDGSHSRASTSTAAIVAHGTASRPSGSSRARTSSSLSARQSVQPSHTSPNVRPRSSRRRLRRTGIAVSGSSGRNRSGWSSSPVIARASARARARPAASSSPRWATVCWTTLRPTRTERTSRQYRWTLPSFRRVVCRRYIAQLIAQPRRRSQCTWSALHAVFDEARSTAARHTTGAAPAAALVTYSTAEVGLAPHELAEEGDALTARERRIELVRDAQHGVIDHHLEMLPELAVVGAPQRRVELGVARREAPQHLTEGLAGHEGLGEELAARAVAPHVPGHPRGDLHRRAQGGRRVYFRHRSLASQSRPSFLSVSRVGLPVLMSYPTVSYHTSRMRSHWSMTLWSLAGPSTGCEP